AEAEPSLDVDGHDAAQKTGLLASLAHGFWVRPEQVATEGIRQVTQVDMRFAAQLGYTIKLLGVVKVLPAMPPTTSPKPSARRGKPGSRPAAPAIQVAVYPALVPDRHVLASVNHAFNAIAVRGDVVGDTLFYGRGAGAEATASSVLSDLADAALDLKHGSHDRVPAFVAHAPASRIAPPEQVASRFYVRLTAIDRPGVFASIAGVLGRSGISISSIIQPEGRQGDTIPVILMTHEASLAGMHRALGRIARLGVVRDHPVMMRVETFD
ncbi:MAG: homoserine dehydrogenase, partial [Verrucomicrobiota bacterium]